MSVNIHGKEYITVAERVEEAHKKLPTLSITTEILNNEPVVIKATVVTDKGTYTGISAANPSKMIEKQSPYEVAETSAVGRALGFAGFGVVEGIATADEISKAGADSTPDPTDELKQATGQLCSECNDEVTEKVAKYSSTKYGKVLCYKCQKKG